MIDLSLISEVINEEFSIYDMIDTAYNLCKQSFTS